MGTGRPLQMSSSPVLCAQCTSALLNASSRSMQAGVQNVKMTKLMAYVSFVALIGSRENVGSVAV